MALLLTPDAPLTAEHLGDVIAGLGGIVGFLVLPTVSAWVRLLLRIIEGEGAGLGARRGRLDTMALARALALSTALGFVLFNWQRAAGELLDLRLGAAVVGPSLTGLGVGLVFWIVYALGIGSLRTDVERARIGRRFGGSLR